MCRRNKYMSENRIKRSHDEMLNFFKQRGKESATVVRGNRVSVTMNSRFEVTAVQLSELPISRDEVSESTRCPLVRQLSRTPERRYRHTPGTSPETGRKCGC